MEEAQKEKKNEMSILWFLVIIVVWVLLQAYILPKLGISTWLRNSCQVGDIEYQQTETLKKTK